jgi:hypothetical protein
MRSPPSRKPFGGATLKGGLMKTRPGIAVLALVVLISLVAASRPPEPTYSLRIQPSAKGIELVCEKGCAWKTLAATCETAPCSFQVDEFGVR